MINYNDASCCPSSLLSVCLTVPAPSLCLRFQSQQLALQKAKSSSCCPSVRVCKLLRRNVSFSKRKYVKDVFWRPWPWNEWVWASAAKKQLILPPPAPANHYLDDRRLRHQMAFSIPSSSSVSVFGSQPHFSTIKLFSSVEGLGETTSLGLFLSSLDRLFAW